MKTNYLLIVYLLLFTIFRANCQPLTINWQACYGGQYNQESRDVIFTDDGYIVVGTSYENILIVKFNLTGELVWEHQYGGILGSGFYNGAYRIFKADPENYYIVATAWSSEGDITYDPYPDANNCWILKIDSEGNIIWDKIFGGSCSEYGSSGTLSSDSSVIFYGNTCSSDGDITENFGLWDVWMIKVDTQGNKVWDKSLGNDNQDGPSAMIQTSDNGFLAATYSYYGEGGNIECENFDPNMEFVEAVLLKLDENANLQWQRCYGGSRHDDIDDIVETEDGYLLACSTNSSDRDVEGAGYHLGYDNGGHITSDIWLVKTDFEGNIVWSKCYGGYYDETSSRVFRTGDGGYIVFGSTSSNDGDVSGYHNEAGWFRDIWVIKVSSTGQLQWQQCIGGAGNEDIANAVIQLEGGKYVFSATLNSNNTGDITCITDPNSWSVWLVEVTDTTVSLPEKNETNIGLIVYPNPASNYVIFEQTEAPQGNINIYNAYGKLLMKQQTKNTKTLLDTKILSAGMYFYTFEAINTVQTGKIMVVK